MVFSLGFGLGFRVSRAFRVSSSLNGVLDWVACRVFCYRVVVGLHMVLRVFFASPKNWTRMLRNCCPLNFEYLHQYLGEQQGKRSTPNAQTSIPWPFRLCSALSPAP